MFKTIHQHQNDLLRKGGYGSGRHALNDKQQAEVNGLKENGKQAYHQMREQGDSHEGAMNTAQWEQRVQEYEAQGLTRSDAQGAVDAEDMNWRGKSNKKS